MYRAGDARRNQEWLAELETVASDLELSESATTNARDLFLSTVPDDDRSKRPALAASVYAGALIAGDERSQSAVAENMAVSRLSIQQRWKDLLRDAGFQPPRW